MYWGDIAGGGTFVRGTEYDIDFDASLSTRHVVDPSTATVRVVCVKGDDEVLGQSSKSRILVKFIYHSGTVDLA